MIVILDIYLVSHFLNTYEIVSTYLGFLYNQLFIFIYLVYSIQTTIIQWLNTLTICSETLSSFTSIFIKEKKIQRINAARGKELT